MKTNAAIHMADSVIQRYPVTGLKWAYEWGLALKGVLEVWKATGESKYFDYVKRNVDLLVQDNGSIRTYQPEDYNIDQINAGKVLFPLVKQTGDERYLKAIQLVRSQLRTHPRTKEGGFWHKLIYPHQMWLDGIYMAAPFLAQYGATFGEAETFDDVVHQITL
ncbi:MAG TPA: glycoside hydrolase family 88 protein, partial [Aggregatilineaceae bacterium]|nr:glycoside hydrolase family 88 protein [Aggregatilineaceae bacterium]